MDQSTIFRVATAMTLFAMLSACKADGPTAPVELIFKIEARSSVNLEGQVGIPVTPNPVVEVTDSDGHPAAGVDVAFVITGDKGLESPTHLLTDPTGRATVSWILGTAVGNYTLKASVGTLDPIVFSAKAFAGPPALMEATGTPQTAAVGTVPSSPLKVHVTDFYSNPLKGVTVSFTAGSGTIDQATQVTDSVGNVTAGTWTLGPTEGPQYLVARAGGLSVTFSADTFDCSTATDANPCAGLGELLFSRNVDGQIYRMRIDGKGLMKLTNTGSNYNPVWSADGRRIAFIRYTPGQNNGAEPQEVFTMNADGSNVKLRTSIPNYGTVAWSPDGRKLAVASYPGGSDYSVINIMSADEDGTPQVLLVVDGAEPVWSPDGSQIAYVHGTGYYDSGEIYVVNADGTGAHRVSPHLGYAWSPAWSPDGHKIAFSQCTQSCTTYIMGADGSSVTPIIGGTAAQEISWSPNGKWLSYSLWSGSVPSVLYIPVEGSGNPRLVLTDARHATWRPRLQ